MARLPKRTITEKIDPESDKTQEQIVSDSVNIEKVRGKRIRKPNRVIRPPEDDEPTNDYVPVYVENKAALAVPDDAILPLPSTYDKTMQIHYVQRGFDVLSSSQCMCIELLADMTEKRNVVQCAAELDINPSTIYKWFNNPVFSDALETRARTNFINIGKFKLMHVYNRELDKNNPGSRVLEQVAKTLGFFSDGADITLAVQINTNTQSDIVDSDL